MKVLPVYPQFPISFWSFKYAVEMMGKKSSMPPLGLATVLGMLPNDIEIQPIVDMNVSPLTDEQIANSDLILTSSMIVQKNSLEEVIKRAHSQGKKVVAGGPYPTSYHDELAADHIVLGEAEPLISQLAGDLQKNVLKRIYSSVPGTPKPSVRETPLPRWDLLDLPKYAAMTLQYSRGCPYDCEFCDVTALFGQSSRTKSPEQMIKEMDALRKAGWSGSVFMVDDNFIGNKRNVRQLLPELKMWQKEQGYPFDLYTEASMDLASSNHADIREGMVDAGFNMVFTGVESVDPEVIKKMHKGQNLGRQTPYEKIEILQRSGLEVTAGFIIGSDGEKRQVFDHLFRFIQDSGIIIPMVGLLTAIKGTKLYDRLQREGRLREETSGNNTHHLGFNFKPELDETFLVENYATLLDRLFEPRNFYERCRISDERRGAHIPNSAKHRVNRYGLEAFAKIVYQNVVREPNFDFVRYMAHTLLTHPRRLPEATTHAVKLHHFRKMTQGTLAVRDYHEQTEGWYALFKDKAGEIRGNTQERLSYLKKLEEDLLRKAKRQYGHIHEDFRHEAYVALERLKVSLQKELSRHQASLA